MLWTAHPENEVGAAAGFWEEEVLGTWERVKPVSRQWWEDQWITHFRMDQDTFCFLVRKYGHLFARLSNHMRRKIPPAKRLAIALYFIAHAEAYSEISGRFRVGTSTVANIVHQVVTGLVGAVAEENILFPVGRQLNRTMRTFQKLPNLLMCCGAVDGTFMGIVKPEENGDAYWTYKGYTAILLLACVDSQGLLTFIDIGVAGCIGDAAVYNNSQLKAKIDGGEWLNAASATRNGVSIHPFLIGDSAFSLKPSMMKIYKDDGNLSPEQLSFNYCQICARRVVECAFERLKKRFAVVSQSFLKDPHFASQVGLLCCSPHNIISHRKTGFLPCYANYAATPAIVMLCFSLGHHECCLN
ncbi:uncharacterized protein LOC135817586 [Sycon ciliatum]|uniref:uncharacterized protein LOC135817586 n=1 Tax=Sycon ciliatum TaxID=27933 RepID=UPI0031F60890